MAFRKTILFPFPLRQPYFDSYAWAVELAFRMKAKLQLLTSTGADTENTDSVYFSLLEAHGHYLQNYSHEGITPEIVREPLIAQGELKDAVISHLQKNEVDITILHPSFSTANYRDLALIVKSSGGVILLGEAEVNSKAELSDRFLDRLRHAELYKLRENFFATLGKDHSVFNYLRKFFQKKSS